MISVTESLISSQTALTHSLILSVPLTLSSEGQFSQTVPRIFLWLLLPAVLFSKMSTWWAFSPPSIPCSSPLVKPVDYFQIPAVAKSFSAMQFPLNLSIYFPHYTYKSFDISYNLFHSHNGSGNFFCIWSSYNDFITTGDTKIILFYERMND